MKAKAAATPEVDAYLSQAESWREEMKQLRRISLGCGLTEELKWGKPCYTFQANNVLIIQPFKEYCALMFCQGALLKDPKGILQRPGEHTQAARQIRFTQAREILGMESVVRAYIREAVAAEKAGLKVAYKKTPEPVPEALQNKLDESPPLKAAFHALTPGRQRAYILYFSGAKQAKTQEARVEKYRRQILSGRGMND
jgi:uncharacterized protein YdeI (YjbR/CyaY-like superfamily)